MKALLCLPLLLAAGLHADEAQDRAAIDKIIVALNDPAQRAVLLPKESDSNVDFDHLLDLHRRPMPPPGVVMTGMNEPWTELTTPRIVSGRIRFISPDVAIVDGASTIRGAMTFVRRVPLLFVMKRAPAGWRIEAVRTGAIGAN